MPKRSSKHHQGDVNQTAARIVQLVTDDRADQAPHLEREGKPPAREKNPAAVALGRLGGLKGGRARAEKLSKKRRVAIARKGAAKRWGQRKP
jgi:ABC-type phosphate/phosphonate transport system ATPase subunit